MGRLAEPDALLICVPTPLSESRDPDLVFIEQTARQIAKALRPGQLVVLESTTYPGTTRDVVLPILAAERLDAWARIISWPSAPSGKTRAIPNFSAERIPKVVGGIDPASGRLADLLYRQAVVRTVPVSNCEVAEAAQNPGKHLPLGEHRHGQRAEDALRPHGHRHLGSDRRGQEQALRLPGVLSRSRAWAGTAFPSIRST